MIGPIRGNMQLNHIADRRLLRLAALAVLGAALSLAGCGRKGPLDPPPSSMVSPAPDQPSLGQNDDPNSPGYRRAPQQEVATQPTAPVPPDKRTFFLDPLIK